MTQRIAFTTGTFDIHAGSVAFLKTCKAMLPPDSKLIVGLVTDELAVQQKRRPNMSYEHRRAILIEFPFVDMVVAHAGEPKAEMQRKLHFTDIFIGDEYYGTDEYKAVESIVRVHYVPCPLARQYSSSALAVERSLLNTTKFKVIKDGTAGLVYLFDDRPLSILIKTVRVSQIEYDGGRTSNEYKLPIPPPRNFKCVGAEHKFPNLPGVNAYRELKMQKWIQEYDWCPTTNVTLAYRNESRDDTKPAPPQADWSHLKSDKARAREIYFIHQRFAGTSLKQWIDTHESDAGFYPALIGIIARMHDIVHKDLLPQGIIHGDIHADNICVEPCQPGAKRNQPVLHKSGSGAGTDTKQQDIARHYRVSLIDWGWCLHRSFTMDDGERAYYESCIERDWDWGHFLASLRYSYADRTWFRAFERDVMGDMVVAAAAEAAEATAGPSDFNFNPAELVKRT